ncbi:hypothetical protein [Streptomyces sp. NPDC005799]|uniref:hypothetical protein n=1 Tax=Streptomyces sp. NPDC005799 TaxID=3154678 RepID=UPI0033C42E87
MTHCPPPCGKQRYATKHLAQLACIRIAMTDGKTLYWYLSRPCRCWHLTNPARHGNGRGGRRGQQIHAFTRDQPP